MIPKREGKVRGGARPGSHLDVAAAALLARGDRVGDRDRVLGVGTGGGHLLDLGAVLQFHDGKHKSENI